jgi:hypothetical protein
MEPPAPAGQGGGVMSNDPIGNLLRAKVAEFFGEVALQVQIEGEPKTFFFQPEQAKALAKALGREARKAEKRQA